MKHSKLYYLWWNTFLGQNTEIPAVQGVLYPMLLMLASSIFFLYSFTDVDIPRYTDMAMITYCIGIFLVSIGIIGIECSISNNMSDVGYHLSRKVLSITLTILICVMVFGIDIVRELNEAQGLPYFFAREDAWSIVWDIMSTLLINIGRVVLIYISVSVLLRFVFYRKSPKDGDTK